MPEIVNKDLAAGQIEQSFDRIKLFAGDSPVNTDDGYVVASGQGVTPKYSVVAVLAATGKLVKHNPAGNDGSQFAVGITTQPVDATATDRKVAIYTSGTFNAAALTWNAATDTMAERKAAFARTPIQIGTIRL